MKKFMTKAMFSVCFALLTFGLFAQSAGLAPSAKSEKAELSEKAEKIVKEVAATTFAKANPAAIATPIERPSHSSSNRDGWLTWASDALHDGIGTGSAADFMCAQRFAPADLTNYDNQFLTKISFAPWQSTATFTLMVWGGGSATAPDNVVLEQELNTADLTLEAWNEFDLIPPVEIDATQELWIGYRCNATGGYPAGVDPGPQVEGFGNMMYFQGAWVTLSSLNPDLAYNWAIKGYVQATAPVYNEPAAPTAFTATPDPNQGLSCELSWTNPSTTLSGDPLTNIQQMILTRNGEQIMNFTGVTVGGTITWTDENIPAAGIYNYGVYAVNADGTGPAATANAIVGGIFYMPASGTQTITACGGIIYDDGGPDNPYSASCNGILIIEPTGPNLGVTVEGTVYTETNYDKLFIYDGAGIEGTLLGEYSISSSTPVPTTSSTVGPLTLHFTSDGSVQNDGFELTVTCIDINTNCLPPYALTVIGTTDATATLGWSVYGEQTAWNVEYGPMGFAQGSGTVVAANTNPFTLTGLNQGTAYSFYVQASCGAAGTSAWSGPANFITAVECPTGFNAVSAVIGNETTGTYYFPVNTFYNYSYTQQIFTNEELLAQGAFFGDIHTISFQYFHETAITRNNFTIYMANTNKSTFDSGTDWISVADMTEVYTGTLEFDNTGANYWVEIQLQNQFAYDGASNVVIAVLNNQGDYENSNNRFYAHTTTDNKSLRYYTDGAAIDPGNPASGTAVNQRNNVKFDMCVTVPEMVTVSGNVLKNTGNTPIEGAIVTFQGALGGSLTTAADGAYSFDLVQNFDYQITVTATGYNTYAEAYTAPAQATVTKNLLMTAPMIAVSPAEISISCGYMGQASGDVVITNNGDGPLSWNFKAEYDEEEGEGTREENSYAICALGQDLNSFILNDPANLTPMGTSGTEFMNSAEYVNGTYYFATSTSGLFGTINAETGEITVISTGNPYAGVAYNPMDGNLYGITTGNNAVLYTVDMETGAATQVVAATAANFILGMTITNTGRILLIDAEIDGISELNPTTGELTTVIPSQFLINYGQDMAMDRDNNVPYWAAYNTTAGAAQLYKLNLEDGTMELIGTFPDQASCFAIATNAGPNWMSCVPKNGVIEAGQSQTVAIKGDGWYAPIGTFTGTALFRTGNPDVGIEEVDVTFTIIESDCPAASNLTATLGENFRDVTLNWDAPTESGTYTYNIYASETSQTILAADITGTTYTFLELPITTHTFVVRTVCEDGGVAATTTNQVSIETYPCDPLEMCDIVINMVDDYGDGWNGASIAIVMDGYTFGTATITTGTTGTATIHVCPGSLDFVWTKGSYDSECSFVIATPWGETLYTSETGQQTVAGTFFTYENTCESPDPVVISGTVTKLAGGTAIAGATVAFVGPLGETATTSASGAYSVEILQGYDYTINVSADGYNTITEAYTAPAQATATKNFTMTAPTIAVSPAAVTINAPYEGEGTATVTITNNGNGPLNFGMNVEYDEDQAAAGISYDEYLQLSGVVPFNANNQALTSGKAPAATPAYVYNNMDRADNSPAIICFNTALNSFFLDIPQGTTPVGTFSEFTNCGEYMNGMYYFASSTSGKFGTIDPMSFEITTILNGGAPFTGLAYNPADGQMYGISIGASAILYTVDIATGNATQVVTLTSANFVLGMTITNDGRFLVIDAEIDGLSEINPTTGDFINSWPAGFTVNYGQDMACDRETNTPYWAAFNADASAAQLYSFDIETGTYTLIGTFADQASCFATETSAGWLKATPASGTVAAGSTQTVTLTGTAGEMDPGTYYATAHFTSANPNVGTEDVAVTFIIAEAACGKPQNVQAVADAEAVEVKVTWDAVDDATSYKVYMGTTLVGTVTTNAFTYTDVEYEMEYCFKVSAVCPAGEGPKSNEACSEEIPEPQECDAPTDLEATTDENDVTVTWNYAEPPSDMATIILEAHDVWGDGTGYQILLDADHNTSSGISGNFTCGQSYAEYEYMIPTNATAADDFVVVDGSETIQVPAGVYDYVVLNPGCAQFGQVYVASDQCDASVGSSVTFEAGQIYHFTATLVSPNDCITITNTAKRSDVTFNVYRDGTEIATGLTEHTYLDADLANGTYCYTATAVCADGTESEPSNEDCETVVGINELDAAFQIFPNPADAKVTVKGENVESIAVYNVLGQRVDNIKVTDSTSRDINTAAYESGVYMLRITTTDGTIVSKRVVIAH